MRMPTHLRKFAQDYALEDWVDNECPLDTFFETVHVLSERLKNNHSPPGESSAPEEILVNLVANFLDAEGTLEDYVLAQPVSVHNLNEEGAMVPVHKAAAVIIVRRYTRALDQGEWSPTDGGGDS